VRSSSQPLAELASLSIDGARFVEGPGGLARLDIETPLCRAQVYPYGAQVMQWAPTGHAPVLFASPRCQFQIGKGMRGGVPVCFPWFADRTHDPRPAGAPSPNHGFVRTRAWRVEQLVREQDGQVRVLLWTRDDDSSRALWDHAFEAMLEISLGSTLSITFEVKNTGDRELLFEEALHSYFEVGDVARTRVVGLEPGRVIDKVDGRREKAWAGASLGFGGEVDLVFVGSRAAVTIEDDTLSRRIVVDKSGSRTTVVWNPGAALAERMADIGVDAWRRFVCVESANAAPHAVPLPPGARHALTQKISVSSITAEV
jgi:glucose-6-phosphate 1-epimerase